MYHICGVEQGATDCTSNHRKIDTMFLSIGLNDVKFSKILKVCADFSYISDLTVDDIFVVGAVHLLLSLDWDRIKDEA